MSLSIMAQSMLTLITIYFSWSLQLHNIESIAILCENSS